MQKELDASDTAVAVEILGINEVGLESGNASITEGRDLAWLQETEGQSVWTEWGIAYRDVVILDEDNKPFATYNLTNNDLSDAANYEALLDLFLDAAGG